MSEEKKREKSPKKKAESVFRNKKIKEYEKFCATIRSNKKGFTFHHFCCNKYVIA